MADGTDFLHQSYSFLYNVLLESVIAVIVLAIATLLTKMFKRQEDGHNMGPGDTIIVPLRNVFDVLAIIVMTVSVMKRRLKFCQKSWRIFHP